MAFSSRAEMDLFFNDFFFPIADLGIKTFYLAEVWQRKRVTRGTIQSLLDIYHLLQRDNQTFQI